MAPNEENYQIDFPYQFRLRDQSLDGDAQLPNKKMKTLFLWNMSKSRRLTSTFSRLIAHLVMSQIQTLNLGGVIWFHVDSQPRVDVAFREIDSASFVPKCRFQTHGSAFVRLGRRGGGGGGNIRRRGGGDINGVTI